MPQTEYGHMYYAFVSSREIVPLEKHATISLNVCIIFQMGVA